ncbi:MAG: HAD family hydrolase, partial [Candidatus Heimdallarchaeota archaeon]|nr:HAD family hydrolase [Candidatus Heimdallarchaeota archaeon]
PLEKQEKLLKKIQEEPSYANYWSIYKQIQKIDFSKIDISANQKIKIALLSSFTIDPLAAFLDIDCRMEDLLPEIYVAPFNRFQEEIIDDKSKLYKFKPEIIFFFIELESLLEENFLIDFTRLKEKIIVEEIDRVVELLNDLLAKLAENTDSMIVFSNFISPTFSPMGVLDKKREIGMKRFYRMINDKLETQFQSDSTIFIFDFDETASRFGKDEYINYPMYYRGSLLLSEKFLPAVSYDLMSYIKPLKGRNRKCIVLDLDNTLWGGIIGEDGLDGIKLNINYPGNHFVDFQKAILSLFKRGIILAVNSKNNEADALEVFQKHPYMQIKETHLAAHRINWNDKVQNMIELAEEINIGLDSMVFFDDNPVERARVREALPDVKVVDLPKSPALYKKTLEQLNDFNTLAITKEDLTRGEKYYFRKQREGIRKKVQSIDEFIKTLEIVATIKLADKFALPRVTSLINRTNQFNVTTRRYTEAQVEAMHKKTTKFNVYILEIKDKFGEEGIVGIAVVNKENQKVWQIDT